MIRLNSTSVPYYDSIIVGKTDGFLQKNVKRQRFFSFLPAIVNHVDEGLKLHEIHD